MTTWEPATEGEVRAIRALLAQVRNAGETPPPLPESVKDGDFSSLTRREAGVLLTMLREMVNERR